MRLDIPSESFGEAIEILDRRSWPCVGSGPLVSTSCSPSRGTGLLASPDQGYLFLLLRLLVDKEFWRPADRPGPPSLCS